MADNVQPNPADVPVDEKDLYLAFRLMRERDLEGARLRLEEGLHKSQSTGNRQAEALYLSAFGVLSKLLKDYKQSYKYYQQAEKILPDDASLKIITATLLIEEFGQYDTAARKLAKIIESDNDPSVCHHARALLATAYLLSGRLDEAKKNVELLIESDFSVLRSASNVNYRLPETMVRRNFQTELAKDFLMKARKLAEARKEQGYIRAIEELFRRFETLR